jgi:hypothetical protein
MGWYSFCGIFKVERIDAAGNVREDASLVEERVVLFRADDIDEAIRLGEAEAELYARETWPNTDGDIVRNRYLGVCNVFDIKATPAEGVEVYSRLLLRSSAEDDDTVIERLFGSESEQPTNVDCFEPDFDRVAEMRRKGDRSPE